MADLNQIQLGMEEARAKAVQALELREAEGLTESRMAELDQEYEAAMADFDRLEAEGKRALRLRDAESAIQRYVDPDPQAAPPLPDVRGNQPPDPDEVTYEEAFRSLIRSTQGDDRMTPEIRAALQPGWRKGEKGETRDQATGTGGAGGYLIPEGFMAEIVKTMEAWGPMMGSVPRVLMTDMGNDIEWPRVDDTDSTGGTIAENTAIADQDITFDHHTIRAYNYDSGMVKLSWQLLEDSGVPLESMVAELLGERLGRGINTALTTGTGSSQPQGIVTGGTDYGTRLSKTAAPTVAELHDLYTDLDPAYRMSPNCAWMMHDDTMGIVRKLTYGTTDNNRPLWQMGDISKGMPDTLLGRPVYYNQAIATRAANARIIVFGDMKKMLVRKVRGMQMVTLRERFADLRQNGMFAWCRVDGRVLDPAAIRVGRCAA